LTLVSGAYGRVALFRRGWYQRHPERTRVLSRPVISVGNLVVGGSGKTPVVAALAQQLLEWGHRPAILSRGYGRKVAADGVVVVSDGTEVLVDTARSGDEPQMLARSLPGVVVAVSPDRHLAGTLAEQRFGCSVHLLDDGFQHVQLRRDVNLLLVSREDLEEEVMPAGRLREPLDAAAQADAVIVSGTDADVESVAGRLQPRALFGLALRYEPPRLIEPYGETLPAAEGRRVVAVAAIARAERFFNAVREQGWDLRRAITFRDHHWFTARDVRAIHAAAADEQADLVITTHKDAMRFLAGRGFTARQAGREGPPYAYLPMHVTIEPAEGFAAWLQEQLTA
jgi:tetraacyldisaccharide 4'-kinase